MLFFYIIILTMEIFIRYIYNSQYSHYFLKVNVYYLCIAFMKTRFKSFMKPITKTAAKAKNDFSVG